MVTYYSYSGNRVWKVQDADSFGFPLAFLDGEIHETEYNIHYAEGDYRESRDFREFSPSYQEISMSRGNSIRKITTTLHRQLEGTITELPFDSSGNMWYLPIQGWYHRRRWTYYDYHCRIYEINGFIGKFYISHDIRSSDYSVSLYSWCYHQLPDQPRNAEKSIPQFEGYSFSEWQESTPNGGIFKELKRSNSIASARRAVELAISCMTSPVPSSTPIHSLKSQGISTHTPGEIDEYLRLCDLHDYKLPYIDQCYLAQLAYQNLGYIDNNGIAFVHDLLEFRQLMTGMVDTIKRTLRSSNNKRRVQGAAQTYLAEHYGLRLMFADIKDYVRRIRRVVTSDQFYSDRRCSASLDLSSESGWRGAARYTCYYSMESDSDYEAFSEILRLLDLVPSLENIWDLMPWTFVIDWFISIGDELTALDNVINLSTAYSVKGWTITCDVEREIQSPSTETALSFNLTERYFSRRIGHVPILPLPPINVAQSTSSPLDHFVEGAALVVTNR